MDSFWSGWLRASSRACRRCGSPRGRELGLARNGLESASWFGCCGAREEVRSVAIGRPRPAPAVVPELNGLKDWPKLDCVNPLLSQGVLIVVGVLLRIDLRRGNDEGVRV